MKKTYWWLVLGLALVSLIQATSVAQKPAAAKQDQFYLGVKPTVVLKTLGQPTSIDEMRGEWNYGNATVRFQDGKVISWRGFAERPPDGGGLPVVLGVSREDVAASLGFPPGARTLTGLVIGKKPIGEEEWTYRGGTLVFQDGYVVGWRKVTNPLISLGDPVPGAKQPQLGAGAKELIMKFGSPPALTCYVKSGDQLWSYPDELFLLREGKLIWSGLPQSNTTTVAEQPPVIEDGPAPAADNGDQTQEGQDQAFYQNPAFGDFRIVYQRVLDKMTAMNPAIVNTQSFKAMQDCLNQNAWWAVKAQAQNNQEYANGVQAIANAFNDFLKSNRR